MGGIRRDLALIGFSSVRLDFSGWGESPDLGHAPGRPYDQHGMEEVREAVAALRELGHQQVVVAGLCAGAWVALKAAVTVDVDGVVADQSPDVLAARRSSGSRHRR